jgi:hypothetical protein
MFDTDGSRNCDGPPKMLFHQYHTETFQEVTLDDDVFAVPEICQNTKNMCVVEPTNFCGD